MRSGFILIVFFLAFAALAAFCLQKVPHDFADSECVLCHEGNSEGTHGIDHNAITSLCLKCHPDLFSEGYMHPVDVNPQKVTDIPVDMPLSSLGRITCITCHDVHAPYLTPLGERSYFLRRYETGIVFCNNCHTYMQPEARGHPTALGEAHMDSKYIATDVSQEIDPMSKNCISCHDGAYASSVRINAGVWTHSSSKIDTMSSHPIGVDYEEARTKAGRKTDLRPIDEVDQRILFFEGKVGCGTCHNPYGELMSHLVMENARSRLCFACHMIDR